MSVIPKPLTYLFSLSETGLAVSVSLASMDAAQANAETWSVCFLFAMHIETRAHAYMHAHPHTISSDSHFCYIHLIRSSLSVSLTLLCRVRKHFEPSDDRSLLFRRADIYQAYADHHRGSPMF